ncbi:MAG: hypothetical protein ACI9WC_000167 [Arenicella sp.]|jgi:hypothetical protein
MFKFLFFFFPLLYGLSACVSQPVIDPNKTSDLQLVSAQIESMNADLSKNFLLSCAQNIEKLDQKLDQKLEPKVVTKVVERCTTKREIVKKRSRNKMPDWLDGKQRLGSIEKVRLVKEKVVFPARIDTGADNSSLGVFHAKAFERDGKNWVRFTLEDSKNATTHEYPIYDTVKIKQSSTVTVDRVEIKMDIVMGRNKYRNQIFNLADRGFLEFQLLMGRSFLKDIAIVDVSRKNLQKLE